MKSRLRTVLISAGACLVVVAGGILGMVALASSRQAPPHKPDAPNNLSVSAVPVEMTAVRLRASGYGQAEVVNSQEISPQVSGNIVAKHPALEEGGMVDKGAILFKIEETDYVIARDKAAAQVKLDQATISRYQVSLERDRDRLTAAQKNTQLAKAEYERLKELYETHRVGTLSNVESAEQTYNSLLDTEKNLEKSIALYPLQIKEARNDLEKNRADLALARLNLSRCTIRAPFSGRISAEAVDTGAYITAGTSALTLADDRVLEIQVPLGDKDAFEVLELGKGGRLASGADQVDCRVESVTGTAAAQATAEIHRVVRYDSASRTLYLAVRVDTGATGQGIPLAEGMFCKVDFQGRLVENTLKVPLAAINADNTVYLARDQRLKTLKVSRVTADDTHVWVTGAFDARDYLILSSLSNPVENTAVSLLPDRNNDRLAMVVGGND